MYDIYLNAKADAWRFALGKSGKRPLLTVALNPSTATREKTDPTVARVEEVARRNGFDGFVMFNLYPVRAADYRELSSKVNAAAYKANLRAIEELVARQAQPTVWAAWGACVEHHRYFEQARDELFKRLRKHGPTWVRFGELTQHGHPRHPSRLDYSWRFEPYTAETSRR
jgi:hypothetical protein